MNKYLVVFRGKVNSCLLERFIQCGSPNSVYVKTAYVVDCCHHPRLWVGGDCPSFSVGLCCEFVCG